MILLTKINNNPIAVNSDLIEYIEETPDTVITLTNSDRVVVQEGMTEIIEKVVQYRRSIAGLVEAETDRQLRHVKPRGRLSDAT
jgi:flagellar protein FlbD